MNQEIKKISRSNLIAKCDQYLSGEIEEKDFENYAWNLITEEHFDWEDDVISDIIYQWDSPEINFPITKQNIKLWKLMRIYWRITICGMYISTDKKRFAKSMSLIGTQLIKN